MKHVRPPRPCRIARERSTVRFLLAVTLAAAALAPSCTRREAATTELRGVWLTNVDSRVLESRAQIAEAMEFLVHHNFNAVFPVVWNKGVTLYPSATMDSLFGLPIDTLHSGRDPLAEVIAEARPRGLKVIPWFEFGFSSSYRQDGGAILRARPDWAERDSRGGLLSKNGFEWMNPYHPEVQEFMLALVLEVVRGYEVDGVQGDDRLPANPSEGGYSAVTTALYAAEHGGSPPPSDPRDSLWLRWRADRLTAFAHRLYERVKSARPGTIVSWAPGVYPWAYEEYLQDWPAWVRGGCADIVHPQVYRTSLAEYRRTLDSQLPDPLGLARPRPFLYPGILAKVGGYLIDRDSLIEAIRYNRSRGVNGEVLFFYEALRADNDALGRALVSTVYARPARFPDEL